MPKKSIANNLKNSIRSAKEKKKVLDVSNLDKFGKQAKIKNKITVSMDKVIDGVYSSNLSGAKKLFEFGVITEEEYENFMEEQRIKGTCFCTNNDWRPPPMTRIKLDISECVIKSFPVDVFKFDRLESLNLRNNKLTAVPNQISNLINLVNLDLSNNRITQINPGAFTKLSKLVKLNLSGNQLFFIPKQIENLVNWTSLNLSGNRIIESNLSIFSKVSKLQI